MVVADAALRRTADGVMVDPKSGKNPNRVIVHRDREINGQFPFGMAKEIGHILFEAKNCSSLIKLLESDPIRTIFRGGCSVCQRSHSFNPFLSE
jgi:hypothetical protein